MEDVYANTKKVMVDTKSGNNLLYLPLNQLNMGNSSGFTASDNSAFDPAISAAAVDQARRVNQRTTRDGIRSGTRERR